MARQWCVPADKWELQEVDNCIGFLIACQECCLDLSDVISTLINQSQKLSANNKKGVKKNETKTVRGL